MKIPRISMITLGVADLERSRAFYSGVLATPPDNRYNGVTFFALPGSWLSLYPADQLAEDISAALPATRAGFSGITLAHNARGREEVTAILQRAEAAGARILKPARETFWGGFSGYFADPDEHVWEIAWGPMFDFGEQGEMRFKPE